ncbi:hypothetical protein HC762_01020 [bacterium]|nr:hypothetical protein [bacterium]
MNLDKLYGQAKHAAWYDDPEDPPTYNPFRKVRSRFPSKRNTLRNAENGDSDGNVDGGLTRSVTDQEHQHADVLNRQIDMGIATGAHPKSHTAPVSNGPRTAPIPEIADSHIRLERTASPQQDELSIDQNSPLPSAMTKESASSHNVEPKHPSPVKKPRQRKGLKGIFHRSDQVASESPDEGDNVKPQYTFGNQIKATLFNSWINVLLIAGMSTNDQGVCLTDADLVQQCRLGSLSTTYTSLRRPSSLSISLPSFLWLHC